MSTRPKGLTVFATINFVFAVGLIAFVGSFVADFSADTTNKQESLYFVYTFLSVSVTAALLTVSGVGFLRVSYRQGYLVGLAFCVFAFANVFLFVASRGFQSFGTQAVSLIYPGLLGPMLLFKYKSEFSNTAARSP